MQRRKAIAIAGAATMTAASAALAVGANLGVFAVGESSPARLVSETSQVRQPVVVTRIVDIPSPDAGAGNSPRGADEPVGGNSTATSRPDDHPSTTESAPPTTTAHRDDSNETEPPPEAPHPDDSHPSGGQPGTPAGDG